jgi:phosphate transport system ATP-binding protein
MFAISSTRRDCVANRPAATPSAPAWRSPTGTPILATYEFSLWYGAHQALDRVTLHMSAKQATAIIGPSGCGKSSYLRSLNRMNDDIPKLRSSGKILYQGIDISCRRIRPVEVRRRIGMLFQKPNPFPKSIYENLAFVLRVNGYRRRLNDRIEQALRMAALWDEVKDKLHRSALELSGGQQQRLCLARALIHEPEVLLMDEPCSALDPIATSKIEEVIARLKETRTVVIVTHNLQQAARVSDTTAFLWMGRLVEVGRTADIFGNPTEKLTEDYLTGRFG